MALKNSIIIRELMFHPVRVGTDYLVTTAITYFALRLINFDKTNSVKISLIFGVGATLFNTWNNTSEKSPLVEPMTSANQPAV